MPESQPASAAAPVAGGTPGEAATAVPAAPPAAPAAPPAAPAAPLPQVDVPFGSRIYEIMWLVDANAGRENISKVMTGIKEVVEKSGATWINGDKWEERRLAYTIKKRKRGLYILSHILSNTQNITKLERNIQISDLILRALILVDEDGLTLVPVMRGPDDDDDGGAPGERSFFRHGDRGGRSGYGGGGGGEGRRRREDRRER